MRLSDQEEKWLKKAAAGSGEKIEESSIFLSLLTANYKEDPLCALQLGIAIMLGKPIAIVVAEGVEVPEALAKLAECIQTYSDDDGPKGFQDAVATVVKEMDIN